MSEQDEMNKGQPLMKVFRGSWRGLGETGQGFGMIFDFTFRQHLHRFPGARLHVLMSIALHSNEDGQAFPSYDLLTKETGYGRDTIAAALNDLCSLEIEGHRVLLRYREHDDQGKFIGSNHYILFPTKDELEQYEGPPEPQLENADGGNHSWKKPTLDESTSGESGLEVKPDSKVNPESKESPGQKELARVPMFWAIQEGQEVKNPGAAQAIEKFMSRQAREQGPDLSHFPEDVRPVIKAICELFYLEPPAQQKGGKYAEWIKESRQLVAILGPLGLDPLRRVAQQYWAEANENQGMPPYTIARPAALFKVVVSQIAAMRQAGQEGQETAEDRIQANRPRGAEELREWQARQERIKEENAKMMAELRAQRDATQQAARE